MSLLRRKIVFQIFAIVFFFSSIALVTHFVAKTILVRRRKTGKSTLGRENHTVRGFSPTDCIPSNVLPFSLDQDIPDLNVDQYITPQVLEIDELMPADLRVKRAIKRFELALDELTAVAPEHFPNPEISARILEGIFNFMRKKVRFCAWLELLRMCQKAENLQALYQESFDYLVHTLPKEMEENVSIFENFDLTDRLTVFISTIKKTPKFEDLASNRTFQFLLVDFDMMTAPAHMLRRPVSLKQFHQVTYYISMIGFVCAFRAVGEDPNKYIMSSLEKETNRALALLRFDFDIWGRMTASRRAMEISQRKDVDFGLYGLLPESSKAESIIARNLDL